jgi:hypothetical protein
LIYFRNDGGPMSNGAARSGEAGFSSISGSLGIGLAVAKYFSGVVAGWTLAYWGRLDSGAQ